MRALATFALAAVTAVALGSCSGGSDEPAPEETGSAEASAGEATQAAPPPDPVEELQGAVDATLAASAFSITGDLGVQADAGDGEVNIAGSVDYDTSVADLEVTATAAGSSTTAQLLSDGTSLWVGVDDTDIPALPGGARWLEGDSEQLFSSPTFASAGLVGAVVVLRGVESEDQVQDLGADELDGVAVRRYQASVTYEQAQAAAGEDERALLEDAFVLTGDPVAYDLDVTTAVGEDGVVRDFDLSVVDAEGATQGGYAFMLSDVGDEVAAPEPPDPGEVASGAFVEQLLDQLDQLVAG